MLAAAEQNREMNRERGPPSPGEAIGFPCTDRSVWIKQVTLLPLHSRKVIFQTPHIDLETSTKNQLLQNALENGLENAAVQSHHGENCAPCPREFAREEFAQNSRLLCFTTYKQTNPTTLGTETHRDVCGITERPQKALTQTCSHLFSHTRANEATL